MIASIHQPNFVPWIGYFYKISRSDVFVLLDNVQFTKNSFINRNKIKTPTGEQWLTVPVLLNNRFGQTVREVQTVTTVDWRKKHLGTIEANYRKCPNFASSYPELKEIYLNRNWDSLCDFNIHLIEWAMAKLGLDFKGRIVRSSSLSAQGKSTELLIAIAKEVGADTYLSGRGGGKYQDEGLFGEHGIRLQYTDFVHPTYPQPWGEFLPNLSGIDMLFNCGIDSGKIINASNP